MTTLICSDEKRQEQVRQHQQLNGLDYLEVSDDQLRLTVFFLGKAPVELTPVNVRIAGGLRIQDIKVLQVDIHRYEGTELDDYMDVVLDRFGDFSTYTLKVIEAVTDAPLVDNRSDKWRAHSAFDPRYAELDFNFKVDCPSDFDCKQSQECAQEPLTEPDINYLSKDYASFRRLILDRLAQIMPDWKERHVPDIGITLVEVLAYVGDHLSYYQDAVATEAYLETARKRVSVKRHARLVDYVMHEGCNARAWVCVHTDTNLSLDLSSVYFITGINQALPAQEVVLPEVELEQIATSLYEVFEPMSHEPVQMYRDHNQIQFYTWGDTQCCLAKGATHATLRGELVAEPSQPDPSCDPVEPQPLNEPEAPAERGHDAGSKKKSERAEITTAAATTSDPVPQLHLKPGDVLIFEEINGPETNHPNDADSRHRHAVKLTRVSGGTDPLTGVAWVAIDWCVEDALPFPLCISALGPPPDCEILENISIACANVVLVDHGATQTPEDLGTVPVKEVLDCCKAEGRLADRQLLADNFYPALAHAPLTFCQPLSHDSCAHSVLVQDVRQARAKVSVLSSLPGSDDQLWIAQLDLLGSGPDDLHFVAEMDNEGSAHLRFGNDQCGEQPDAGLSFVATYRIGNGLEGNVGANAISHLILKNSTLDGVSISVRNPMPAQGGTAAELMNEVKLLAPQTFRKELQRAITAEDYAAIVEREFPEEVQRAMAKLRWTGSWYEMLVAIDPYDQDTASNALLEAVSGRLHRYRRIGHDLVVRSARHIPLDIALVICVLPGFLRAHVKKAVSVALGHQRQVNGQPGFFHPDSLSFGDGIFLSRLVAIVQAIDGVESVQVTKLQRLHELPNQEIEQGVLPLDTFEIAQLNNDPNFPEHGRLVLDMRGGR